MTHTPGPWTYDSREGEISPGPRARRNSVGRFHCGRDDAGQDARPIKADACLIAAAPELLEALEGLQQAIRVHWRGSSPDAVVVAGLAAEKVIAKARGVVLE